MCIFLLWLFLYVVYYVDGLSEVEEKILKYGDHTTQDFFRKQWKKYEDPIHQSINVILKETYETEGMNVYIRKMADPRMLGDGVFVSDNIVKVLLKDLYLTEQPRLTFPVVSIRPAENVLRLAAKVNKLCIQADYQLFRNLSDITYNSAHVDPYKTSPFNFQQVKSDGQVTIIAEHCSLEGLAVVSLLYHSVNLGQDTIKLRNCMFSVEITTPGLGSPPVIAPYFSKKQGLILERLLTKPTREALLPKLQGALFTYVNTSSIFGKLLPKIRKAQKNVFKQTYMYLTRVIRNMNKVTLNENQGIEKFKDIFITWSDKNYDGQLQEYKIALKNMTITGLDSAYSAQNGGPVRVPTKDGWTGKFQEIRDTIRISDLQIKGTLEFGVDATLNQYAFYGEIQDVTTCMSFDIANKTLNLLEVYGWRNLDLHVPDISIISERSLIAGIILNELPPLIERRLTRSFYDAFKEQENKRKRQEEKSTEKGCGENKVVSDNQTIVSIDMGGENNKDVQYEMNVIITSHEEDGEKSDVVNKDQDNSNKEMSNESKPNVDGGGNNEILSERDDGKNCDN
ncbi:hypothetical protein ABMA28_016756 [Loxostege sticticalis]|uniref:Uncharacterized protein n=1 Tax=Loxostege sticticalis TaxID=481309 RepID=A0ABD0T5R7_LOXSC